MRSNSCPKCTSTMAEGFMLDHDSSGGHKLAKWIGGAPDQGFFGLKLRGKPSYPIQTWRCGRCGFLESYARG